MENQRSPYEAQGSDRLLARSDEGGVTDASQEANSLEQPFQSASAGSEVIVFEQKHKFSTRLRWPATGLAILALLLCVVFWFMQRGSHISRVQAGNFRVIRIPLANITAASSTSDNSQKLKINGQLEVTNSLILKPTAQPGNPLVGQIYYDQTSNQLAYYNGQQFINVGGQTGNTINVVNVLTGGGASTDILLQPTSPGVQQAGNFNISGTGIVGTLKTTVIDSSGAALFVNPSTPVGTTPQPGGTPATLGLVSGSQPSSGGENNVLIATKATMPDVGGAAKSFGVYIIGGSASSHIQVGLYEDDGDIPSKPATLLAASAITNLVPNAFNTLTIPSTALSPNTTYWLAFNTDDPAMKRQYNGGSQVSCFITSGFGFMPNPFEPLGCFNSNQHYAIYVNYLTAASGGGSGGSFGKAQFSLSPTGQALFQNIENSPTAFQIQNALGTTTVFNVDTVNGLIAIGKSSAAYKLDIAGGDINLSNNRSLRFGGLAALSSTASGLTTLVSNFTSGGSVATASDNFAVQDINGGHNNLLINNAGAATFSNRIDSATGFQIQNASAQNLVTVDTLTGSITLNGGAISLNGNGASNFSTSAGALTLTSATAATWSVAAASSGIGGDLTLRAGNGGTDGNNDGGDLVLQGGNANGTGIDGSVTVRPQSDSANIFQLQNAAGTPLFIADSSAMRLIVAGTDTAYSILVVSDSHISFTQTTPPTIGTPANCGTAPTAAIMAGSTDSAGSFVVTTGTGGTSSTCDTIITFNKPYGAAPKSILVVGKTDGASAARQIYVSAETSTTFSVIFATSAGGANSTPYNFNYWVIE